MRDSQRRAAADAVRAGRAVATGHTRDDRVETILYRLAASPGSAAFAALPAADGDGRVRPLLELSRDEVRSELRRAGIAWRDDSSNGDRSFARNRVRLDLLPAFRSLHPAAEANLLRTAVLLAEDDAALDALAADLLCDGGGLSHCCGRDGATGRAAAGLAARRGLSGAPSGSGRARRLHSLARARERARFRSAPAASPSAATAASRSSAGGPPSPPQREVALAVPGRTLYGETRVHCALATAEDALDAALAPGPRPARARAGERLPGARRTIARMLLEARVPRSERARYPVVSAHGEPVALPGIAVAAALRRPSGLVLTLAAT